MGLGSSLYYFYPIANGKEKSKFLSQTYLLFLFIGSVFVLFYILFSDVITHTLNFDKLASAKYEISLYVFFMLVSSLSDHIFTIQKKSRYNIFYFPLDRIVRLVLVVFFVFTYKTFYGGILGLLFYSVVRMVFITIYYKGIFEISGFRPDYKLIRIQFVYALPIAASMLLRTLSLKYDKFLINQYIEPAEYAIYSVAFLSIPFLSQMFQSINNVIVPKLTEYYKAGDYKMAADLWRRSVVKTSSITIPAILFFMVMADEVIVFLYSSEYALAVNYFRMYLFSLVFFMLNRGIILRAFNRTQSMFRIDLITTVILVVVGYFLIRYYSLMGAMATALLGIGMPILFILVKEKMILEIKFKNWLPWKEMGTILLISVIPVALIIPLNNYIASNFLSLVVCAAVFIPFITFFQYRMKLFIYPEIISKILKKIK